MVPVVMRPQRAWQSSRSAREPSLESITSMAILAALFALSSRFATKILTTALGWASTLLFGRVPADRQLVVLGITFGSVLWLALLAGVLVPAVGTFLLVLVPQQDVIPESTIRLAMLAGALVLPGAIGGLTLALAAPDDRTPRRIASAVVRGYPLTVLLAVLLLFLAGLAIWRKGHSVVRRWTDAHVPIVVRAGAYEQVADDLDRAVSAAGLDVTAAPAPASMSMPARWLAAVAGTGSGALVPDRMVQLVGPDLHILIYPMDLLISGKPGLVTRARAAMASRLTSSAAHLTISAEAQAVEDRLTALANPTTDAPDVARTYDEAAAQELSAIDGLLVTIPVPYEEWEVLYRQRLQVERDLRARAMAGRALPEAEGRHDRVPAAAALASLGRIVRTGVEAVAEAAADERTGQAIDRMAGPEWRWAVRVASVAVGAAREAMTSAGPRESDTAPAAAREAGEPARYPEGPGDERGAASAAP